MYTPGTGYQGADSFIVVAKDHVDVLSNQVVINVTVLAPNRAPTCVTPVTVRVSAGGRVPLDHRNGCTDPDGDAIFRGAGRMASHGTFEQRPSGLFDFVAKPGFTGRDQFTFQVT